jgi:glycosyltransferase involved in cell wall biosynthesis
MPMPSSARPVILTCMGPYWPNAGSNGPIKSLVNLAEALGQEFHFKIIGRDRPYGAATAESPVETWKWRDGPGGSSVLRIPAPEFGLRVMHRVVAETPHDMLYLNSFFDREVSIPPLLNRRLQFARAHKPLLIAPRGELAPGSLAIKPTRKTAYITLCRSYGLLKDAWFHATADHEAIDIQATFPAARKILIATNIASPQPAMAPRPDKVPGRCRLIFSGRIARKNNLDTALDILARVKSHVTMDVCGPPEDAELWKLCQDKIAQLPPNITVHAHGALSQADLQKKLQAADAMLQPTRGDNFGHAIVEALQAGLPVIISDRTPWTGLDREGCGWSLPLEPLEPFVTAVEAIAAMDQAAWAAASAKARDYSTRVIRREQAIDAHRVMFREVLAQSEQDQN